jgi:hypothetical protein
MRVSMPKIRQFGRFTPILIILILTSYNLQAQEYYIEDPHTFFGGVVAGANFSQVDGDNYAGYRKTGLNIGGIVYARFAKHVAGSLEILYAEKGSNSSTVKRTNSGTADINSYNIKLNYAEIPVMINYFDKNKANFGLGLSYAQLISSAETATTTSAALNDTLHFERYPFKKNDINFIIGGSLRFFKGFYINLRFQYSILPVREDWNKEFGRANHYNNLWTFRIMYLFGDK